GRAGLAQDPLSRPFVVVLLVDELERERLVRDEVRRRPDRAHPAGAEPPIEPVAPCDDSPDFHAGPYVARAFRPRPPGISRITAGFRLEVKRWLPANRR